MQRQFNGEGIFFQTNYVGTTVYPHAKAKQNNLHSYLPSYKKLTINDTAFKEIKWYRNVRIKCENHSPITFRGDNLC